MYNCIVYAALNIFHFHLLFSVSQSANIVSQIAILFQDVCGSSESSLTKFSDIAIKAIQALIELCTGNFANQQMVLNAQILDMIKFVLLRKVGQWW